MLVRPTAAFKKAILLSCHNALERHGFRRFAREGVDWPIDDDFRCWVGLNTGLYHSHVDVVPFVGVHAVAIERLASLDGLKYRRQTATYAEPMGALPGAAEQRAFTFQADATPSWIEAEADRLAVIYMKYGLPYALSLSSYKVLAPLLHSQLRFLGGYPERYAACLYLMGRKGEAAQFTQQFLQEEPGYFRPFAERFLRLLEESRPDVSAET